MKSISSHFTLILEREPLSLAKFIASKGPRTAPFPEGPDLRLSRLCVAVCLALAIALWLSPVAQAQGALANGARHGGDITPAGDSDSWTFTAAGADTIFLRVGATSFNPRIRVFGPNNEPAGEIASARLDTRDVFLTMQATNSGVYTVVVSSTTASYSGTYNLEP